MTAGERTRKPKEAQLENRNVLRQTRADGQEKEAIASTMLADEARCTAVLGATLARNSEKSNTGPDCKILPQTVRRRLAVCDP